ncbi:MAG: hypothetical protein EBQ92_00845 [Proteobacteria bacterium]|nr:hypothetical protein [Pseudomonadota bacterium]
MIYITICQISLARFSFVMASAGAGSEPSNGEVAKFASSFEPKSLEELMKAIDQAAKSLGFDSKTFSNGVRLLGLPIVIAYIFLLHFATERKHTIVSVGSGRGELELFLRKLGFDVITVDPDPSSYAGKKPTVCTPDYPTVDDLFNGKPELQNNCLMLINWAPPCNPQNVDNSFDRQAIKIMKPIGLIVVHERYPDGTGDMGGGAAGSFEFHEWFTDIKRDQRIYFEVASSVTNPNARGVRHDLNPQVSMIVNSKSPSIGSRSFKPLFTLPPQVERADPDFILSPEQMIFSMFMSMLGFNN